MFQFLSKLYFLQNILSYFVSKISPVLIHNLGKYFAIKKAFYLTSLEELDGDYLEFGVFTGSSFVCALNCARNAKNADNINFFGFDSFEGFGDLEKEDEHPFYKDLNFKTDYNSVSNRVKKSSGKRKNNVHLIKGFFNKSLVNGAHSFGIKKASVILIDNDTYGAALDCLNFITPIIQEGTIIIADDAFSYKGSNKKGVKGAINFWLHSNENISLRKISDYGMGGEIYIVSEIL
jgi:hypothetical protein